MPLGRPALSSSLLLLLTFDKPVDGTPNHGCEGDALRPGASLQADALLLAEDNDGAHGLHRPAASLVVAAGWERFTSRVCIGFILVQYKAFRWMRAVIAMGLGWLSRGTKGGDFLRTSLVDKVCGCQGRNH